MTNQERFEHLADQVLDGNATADERSELSRILTADPAARHEYSEMESLFTDLRAMPRRAAPPDLLPATLAALNATARPGVRRTGWLGSLLGWLAPRPTLRYGAVFAAGAIASALFLAGIRGGDSGLNPTDGTLMPGAGGSAPVELATPAGVLTASIQPEHGTWVVVVHGDLAAPATLTIEHDQRLLGIEPPAGASGSLAPGVLTLVLGGRTSVRITLDAESGAGAPVRLHLAAGDDSARATLEVHPQSDQKIR